jgi:hypothetical protein
MHSRRQLLRWLAGGGFAWWAREVWAADEAGHEAGIRRMRGDVRVNGVPAREGLLVSPGDVVSTGKGSEAVYVVGRDAYLLHADSEVSYRSSGARAAMRVVTGKILSVFGPGERRLTLPTATVGLRGTACYIDARPGQVYFCLCYGTAVITPTADPAQARTIRTDYHDSPFIISRDPRKGIIQPAAVVDHTDAELILLEALVGRKPPFLREGYVERY